MMDRMRSIGYVALNARWLALLAGTTLALAACDSPSRPVTSVNRNGDTAVLSCKDSAGQQAPDRSAISVDGVRSPALAGDTDRFDTLPQWKGSDGRRYLVWKAFLAVGAAAAPYRTVTVVSPSTARLFYASPERWGSVGNAATVPNPSRVVRLPACGREDTGYTGGILVTGPGCVTLAVSSPTGGEARRAVPILVGGC
jgi:hypothetical protein